MQATVTPKKREEGFMTVKELKEKLNGLPEDSIVRLENLTEFGYHQGYHNSTHVKIMVDPHPHKTEDGKDYIVLRQI